MYFDTEVFLAANNILWHIALLKDCSIRINCFELKLSPLRDTLMCNEGIARSELVSPRSISPEINGRQAPCLPTGAAHGPRSVLGYAGVSIIGLLIEKRFLCGCTMPEREIVVFKGASSRARYCYFRSVLVNSTLGAVRLARSLSRQI